MGACTARGGWAFSKTTRTAGRTDGRTDSLTHSLIPPPKLDTPKVLARPARVSAVLLVDRTASLPPSDRAMTLPSSEPPLAALSDDAASVGSLSDEGSTPEEETDSVRGGRRG